MGGLRVEPRLLLSFWCPFLITEAMSRDIEGETGIPVVPVPPPGTSHLPSCQE